MRSRVIVIALAGFAVVAIASAALAKPPARDHLRGDVGSADLRASTSSRTAASATGAGRPDRLPGQAGRLAPAHVRRQPDDERVLDLRIAPLGPDGRARGPTTPPRTGFLPCTAMGLRSIRNR